MTSDYNLKKGMEQYCRNQNSGDLIRGYPDLDATRCGSCNIAPYCTPKYNIVTDRFQPAPKDIQAVDAVDRILSQRFS
ncbi:hypothetical protein ACFL0W_01690 [Nanoarchaeota archaeon]